MKRQLIPAILAFAALCAPATDAENPCCHSSSDTLRIAHLCDPQIGFGPGGIEDDLNSFRIEIENVNRMRPDFVVIAGDMVNKPDSTSIARFKEAAAAIEAPVIYTPGNHDIYEPASATGLLRYRNAFGPDFTVTDAKGRDIISFNSLLLRGGPEEEMIEQKRLINEALKNASSKGHAVIMVSHVPPFAVEVDEKDEYFNLPSSIRRQVLDSFAENGVFVWLAGHTHKTHRNEYGSITILNAENTSCNFDKRPKGFRLLSIAPDNSFTWQFIPNE